MNRLEKLIQELCSNGVAYKTLGEIATDIYRGSGIKREQVTPTGTPCVRYGEIYTTYGIWFDKCVSHTDASTVSSPKYFEYGDILFVITGESVEDIAKSTAYVGHDRCLAGGDIVVLKHEQNPKYLSYALTTTNARKQKSSGKVKSKVVHSSVPAIKDIVIPVPPLQVQSEIVKILDNFTELTARKKPYDYYCKQVFQNTSAKIFIPIRDLGEWTGGCTPSMSKSAYWENGTIPWISSKDMKSATLTDTQNHITQKAIDETSAKLLPSDTVAIVARSGILKHTLPVAYIPFETTINQDIKALVVNERVLPCYAYFVIYTYRKEILKKTKKQGGTVDSLDVNAFMNYKIPLLPIEEQQRIVSALDRFNTLCNDLTSGLPAEIKARQTQYEYYQDKLLTFRELTT